jgi:hypothetical protein
MVWVRRLLAGGSTGNGQLTAVVVAVLLLLLAIEGATLLQLQSLLTVHVFVGMLLIPVVALKLASTGWRMLRYYLRSDEYVRLGLLDEALASSRCCAAAGRQVAPSGHKAGFRSGIAAPTPS